MRSYRGNNEDRHWRGITRTATFLGEDCTRSNTWELSEATKGRHESAKAATGTGTCVATEVIGTGAFVGCNRPLSKIKDRHALKALEFSV
jgi:hypothetical protein